MEDKEELLRLIIRSEERIDRVNEMVCKLVTTIEGISRNYSAISSEYMKHIDKLQECRDDAMKENRELTKIIAILTESITAPRNIINNK